MEEKKPAAPAAASTSTADSNARLFSVLAYIGILWLVPLLAAKDSKLAQFHANQGLVLFLFEIAVGIVWVIPVLGWIIGFCGWIIGLILAITGIINASKGEMKPLPLIGGISILK